MRNDLLIKGSQRALSGTQENALSSIFGTRVLLKTKNVRTHVGQGSLHSSVLQHGVYQVDTVFRKFAGELGATARGLSSTEHFNFISFCTSTSFVNTDEF